MLGELHRGHFHFRLVDLAAEGRIVDQLAAAAGLFGVGHRAQPVQRIAKRCAMRRAAAFELEQIFGDRPAFVFLADAVLLRHAHIVEEDLVHFMVARQRDDRVDLDAFRREVVDQDEGNALLLLFRIRVGPHEAEHLVRLMRARGPDLRAVDDVVVAVRRRLALERGKVGTGAGFRIALAPPVRAVENARQVMVELFLRAMAHQRRPDHGKTHIGTGRRAGGGAFRRPDETLHHVEARAAIFLRPARRGPAALVESLQPFHPQILIGQNAGRQLRMGFQIVREVFLQECAHLVPERDILFPHGEIHDDPPLFLYSAFVVLLAAMPCSACLLPEL